MRSFFSIDIIKIPLVKQWHNELLKMGFFGPVDKTTILEPLFY